ncbi:MAG: VWA domain-containing protein [Acidobacteriaceae bacterium]|nr:VWA domain-containing protein [Acidobacteriaceae bacterium]
MLTSSLRRLLAILLCPCFVLAQTAPAPPATIQVTSRIVYVDVVVRDSYGGIVRGLTERDFHLFEDGKPQPIDFFRDHTHDLPPAPAESANKDDSLSFSNVDPSGERGNSVNIILFDFFNTAPSDQSYARKQMIRFLQNLPPGRQTALFVLGSHLRMLQSFTGSTDRLVAAAKAMQLENSNVQTTGAQQQDLDMADRFADAVGRSASGMNPITQGMNLQNAGNVQRGTDVTRTALDQIAAAVSGYPGRKNLYWMADTFPLYAGPTLEINDLTEAVLNNTMNTLDAAEANRTIASAQIAIYPISLTGLEVGGSGPESNLAPDGKELQRQFGNRVAMHEMINNMADTTGGHAYYGTNDFARALASGFEDGSSYYTLAYRPGNQNWNGKFRKISVKLAASGYSLAYRRGYYAVPDQPPAQFTAAGILNAALQPDTPEATMLVLHSKVQLPDAQHPAVRVDSVIDPVSVTFSTDAKGRRHARLLVTLVAVPETSSYSPGSKAPAAPLPQSSGAYVVDLDPDAFRKLFTTGMPMHQELTLAPGNYRLRLGVTDLADGRTGTLDMPIELAAHVPSGHS